MNKTSRSGYFTSHIQLLNGRLFNLLLNRETKAKYRSEQGKILHCFWDSGKPQTATDIALQTGLANNTLTSMLKRLEEQGLLETKNHPTDRRKKILYLTKEGENQKEIGERLSQQLYDIFYNEFSQEEINQFEAYQERILENLRKEFDKEKRDKS